MNIYPEPNIGQLSASLTSFSRTIDEYNKLAKQELNPAKQEKAYERVKNFSNELVEFREQFDQLRKAKEVVVRLLVLLRRN